MSHTTIKSEKSKAHAGLAGELWLSNHPLQGREVSHISPLIRFLVTYIKGIFVLCFGVSESGKFIKFRNKDNKDVHGMCTYSACIILWYVRVHIRRGLQCCLFRCLGNTRASYSGTAIVQSRFFCAK